LRKAFGLSLLAISISILTMSVPNVNAESYESHAQTHRLPMKDANSYAKDACKEFSKVSSKLPTTQKQLTAWLKSASNAVGKAVPKAASAAKRRNSWNTFLGDFIFIQGELKYMTAYRAFSNARQWDASVTSLKSTCYKLLSK
jgi:hypothetical protein